ncbi:hypothetical protein C8R44DRAFT_986904 [Mycena epipterygia]|nr:hypothetical protein C8R44DRAFT_986904 [Mycena epipterygia]
MDAKYKTPRCFRCKMRKIRCDSLKPCSACVSTSAPCAYEDPIEDYKNPQLRRGAACLSCRRKKKKCDGKMPCRTCTSSKSDISCEYQDGIIVDLEKSKESRVRTPIPSGFLDASRGPFESNSHSADFVRSCVASGSSAVRPSTVPVEAFDLPQKLYDIGDIESPSPFTTSDLLASEWTSPIAIADLVEERDSFLEYTEKRGLNAADNETSPDYMSTDVAPALVTNDSPLNFSINSPSPFFQVPGPNPDSDSDELSEIRKLFLNHRIQLCLSICDNKLAALSTGVAGGLVHPILLHACQLMGYMLAHHLQYNLWLPLPGQSQGETEQDRLGLVALEQFDLDPCPIAFLQTAGLLALYYCNKGEIGRGMDVLAKADKMALDHNLDAYVLESPPPDEAAHVGFKLAPTTERAEVQAALSQLVYVDLAFGIVLNVPSVVDPRLYACFNTLIANPNARAEINFVRTKSVFLFSKVQRLKAQWHQSNLVETAGSEWDESYWALMEALSAHRSFVSIALTRMAFAPELRPLVLSLKVCAIITGTGLAELASLFSGEQLELRRRENDVILEIVSISASFTEEDCTLLDPILSACWKAVMRALEHCIEVGPEDVAQRMHDLPAMAGVIRQQSKTLQRVLPFARDV